MARRRRIHPVLFFLAALPVEDEVLNESFVVDIDGVSLELTFPDRRGTGDWPRLVAPPSPKQDVHEKLMADRRWGLGFNDSWNVWACVASLLTTPAQSPRDAPEVKTLGDTFDSWFLGAREWILVRHGHPRTDPGRTRGTVVAGFDPSIGQWGAGGSIHSVIVVGLRGASINEVQAAFDRATRDESPPQQYRLLLDATTAASQGDNRRAVIDAGTAAEVALGLR